MLRKTNISKTWHAYGQAIRRGLFSPQLTLVLALSGGFFVLGGALAWHRSEVVTVSFFDRCALLWLAIAVLFHPFFSRALFPAALSPAAALAALYPITFTAIRVNFIPAEFHPPSVGITDPFFWLRLAEVCALSMLLLRSWRKSKKDLSGFPTWLPFAVGFGAVLATLEIWYYTKDVDKRLAQFELQKNLPGVSDELISQLDRRKKFLKDTAAQCRKGNRLETSCLEYSKGLVVQALGLWSLTTERAARQASPFAWSLAGRHLIMNLSNGGQTLTAVWKLDALYQGAMALPAHVQQEVNLTNLEVDIPSEASVVFSEITWEGERVRLFLKGKHFLAPARKAAVLPVRIIGNLLFAFCIFLLQRGASRSKELKETNRKLLDEIRRREEIESELRLSREEARDASKAKSEFVTHISHEIRNPLQAIQTATFLLKEGPLSSKQQSLLQAVEISSSSVHEIVSDVLDFSKIESGKLELEVSTVSVRALVQQIETMFTPTAKRKGIKLEVIIHKEVPNYIHGDSLRIKQMLTNLISNSLKFIEKGSISIEVSKHKKDRLSFSVVDTGPGMSEHVMANLFQPFTQGEKKTARLYGGSGLGLTITNLLATKMGGSLRYRSKVGHGTEAVIDIPWTQVDGSKPEESKSIKPVRFKNSFVLVADDDEVNLALTTSVMRSFGFAVSFARDGQQALQAFKKRRFDLVILDIRMPHMDGISALQEIRKIDETVPIIVLSGDVASHDREEAKSAGASSFLAKPINIEVLHSTISNLLGRHSEILFSESSADQLRPKLLKIFLREFPATVKKMRLAVSRNDWKKMDFECHRLTSGAAHLGLQGVVYSLKKLSNCKDVNLAMRWIENLKAEVERIETPPQIRDRKRRVG